MAVQLNDRDNLIFKLIDEHEVLLEKHISWFIAEENKPVLIRDRLRKLFYLDYLLCHRHATKLPWWTTPTKPLVYMLAPISRSIVGIELDDVDRFDADWQRHHLEVANLRMLYTIAQTEGRISKFEWATIKGEAREKSGLDARISFESNGIAYDIGVANNPGRDEASLARLEESLKQDGVEMLLIVARDDEEKQAIQDAIMKRTGSALAKSCFFSTHQELYNDGVVDAEWENTESRKLHLFPVAGKAAVEQPVFSDAFVPGQVRAASA